MKPSSGPSRDSSQRPEFSHSERQDKTAPERSVSAEKNLDALLDLVPRMAEDAEFVARVMDSLPPPRPPRRSPSAWWQQWKASLFGGSADPGQPSFWPPGPSAWAAVGLFFLILLGSWSVLTHPTEAPSTASTRPMAPELPLQVDDAQVVEDLDWILADWHNDLWTRDDLVVVF